MLYTSCGFIAVDSESVTEVNGALDVRSTATMKPVNAIRACRLRSAILALI